VTGVFLSRPLFLRFPDQGSVRTATKCLFKSGRSAAQTHAQIREQFHQKRKIKLAVKPDWDLTHGPTCDAVKSAKRKNRAVNDTPTARQGFGHFYEPSGEWRAVLDPLILSLHSPLAPTGVPAERVSSATQLQSVTICDHPLSPMSIGG